MTYPLVLVTQAFTGFPECAPMLQLLSQTLSLSLSLSLSLCVCVCARAHVSVCVRACVCDAFVCVCEKFPPNLSEILPNEYYILQPVLCDSTVQRKRHEGIHTYSTLIQ